MTYAELRGLSEEELIKRFNDNITSDPNIQNMFYAQLYRDELMRKSQDKATKSMICLTRIITALTIALVIGLVIQIWFAFK